METLNKYFADPDYIVDVAYRNGGLSAGGYGFLSGGFGGGVEKNDWQKLLYTQGYIAGLSENDPSVRVNIYKEIGQAILSNPEKYHLKDDDKEFIQKEWVEFKI